MAPHAEITGRRRPTKTKKQDHALKRKRETVNIEDLEQQVEDLDLANGTFKEFTDLPLSEPTKAGLKAAHFTTLTDIQAKAIPVALKGADILGAAKTGSGKTLTFLIPVLENLYRAQCVGSDAGLGAMIISPTRELAIQIFEVLYKIGRKGHMFAAGLVIGGKSLKEEQDSLTRMNIVVCTPGRMLQHLSQTAAFNVDNLKMLVLDEADRILDMGFQRDVDAIIDYLPRERQTMLFSATQTKRVSDLARLSLQDPEYISVHEAASNATPQNLQQNYTLTPLSEKLDTLWSFLQSAKKSKTLVFLSSAKQVRFVYESFRKMQPGIPLLHLHGRQKQTARLDITSKFASAQASCLFATDVAARGLDFPAVDWVVQVDCPEDADTYIHRVGRTARYNREGRAVLLLDPSEEEGMLQRLEHKKVPIERINVRQNKKQSITNQLANLCFKDPQLKYLAQKAFTSYAKSIYVQRDKEIFQLSKLPLEEFATSMGLPGAPRIKFMKGDDAKARKNAPRQLYSSHDDSSGDDEEENGVKPKDKKNGVRTKYDKMFERVNQDILTNHYTKLIHGDGDERPQKSALGDQDDEDTENEFLSVKRRIPLDEGDDDNSDDNLSSGEVIPDKRSKKLVHVEGAKAPILIDSRRAEKRLQSKKALLKFKEKGTKLVFDDDGVAHPLYELEDEDDFAAKGLPEDLRKQFVEDERARVALGDVEDKALAKEKRREKKMKRKERERQEEMAEADDDDDDIDDGGVMLGDREDGEDPLANFLADAEGLSDEEEEVQRKPRKEKKWFQDSSDSEDGQSEDGGRKKKKKKSNKKRATDIQEPETLEDLERMAAGLLG